MKSIIGAHRPRGQRTSSANELPNVSLLHGSFVIRAVQVLLGLWLIAEAANLFSVGEADGAVTSLILALALVAMMEFLFRRVSRASTKAQESRHLYRADAFPQVLADALSRAQAQIKVFTYPLPDGKIKETLGIVRGISETEAGSRQEFRLAEQEALLLMLKQAYDRGANAVVGVRLTTGTYETSGSQWQVARPVYIGTAVRI
ncbi:heavy metal-binding domain-containing protein [Thiococcus pfennigii]|uniref:heavy metal-binding domain-containing protein n=1 Tax=Thiococcus pfennigii TaxID=1057 RepID=UPI001906AB2C|nr:heavy metal-binding domain-containing protein [Thiococcus pfennigii]